MSARSIWLSSVCGVLGAAALLGTLNACSSDPKKSRDDTNSMAGSAPPLAVDNIGSGGMAGGSAGSAGSSVASTSGTGGAGSGGSAGSAGTAGGSAGSGGSSSSAAGSGGSAGSSSAGSSADAGMPEEDPLGDLLGGGQTSCEGLICLEAADCASLYPDENATCKFTDCVDFMCK